MSDQLTSPAAMQPYPDANLGYLFRLAHQRFRALLDEELVDLDLSAQEYGILSVFETRPELSTSDLARISQVTRQTMHTAILGLEAAGLLERRAANTRVVPLRLTELGRSASPGHRSRPVRGAGGVRGFEPRRTNAPCGPGWPAWRRRRALPATRNRRKDTP